MSSYESMQYTIGTALERAKEKGHDVDVLVEGAWLSGQVVANDGVGVVLDNQGHEHTIIRLERISVVRVLSESPMRRKIPAGAAGFDGSVFDGSGFDSSVFDGAMPMPGPRSPGD